MIARTTKAMPVLPAPGQRVRWRQPQQARAWGWQAVFGPGPFRVVGLVDHSDQALPTGLVLHTELGEREISELWLALAEESAAGTDGCQQGGGD